MPAIRLLLSVVLALLAAGAGAQSPPATAAPPAEPRHLKVVVSPGGFNWPLWVGASQGFFGRNGVTVQLVKAPAADYQLIGVVNGTFQVALAAMDDLVAYREGQGRAGVDASDLVAVMGADNGFLKLTAVPEVHAIADLRGKQLSVDGLTTGYSFALREILERNGLVLGRDYTTVAGGGMLQRYEDLLAHKQAATMLTSPFDVLAQAQGLHVLADAPGALGSYQGLVAVVRRSWAQDNAAAVTGFIRGYRQSLDWLYDPKNREAALALFQRNVENATPDAAANAYRVLLDPVKGFERRARLDEEGARTVVSLREKYGKPAKKLQPVAAYYEPRYYEAASR